MPLENLAMQAPIPAVFENGVFRPLREIDLPEHQQVQLTVAPLSTEERGSEDPRDVDPLVGLRVETGIRDLAEHFDEYRLGYRQP
jgi:predicted DNA-binding antitoxin AbrB/MazE fold protein